jgi:hypothetical protein
MAAPGAPSKTRLQATTPQAPSDWRRLWARSVDGVAVDHAFDLETVAVGSTACSAAVPLTSTPQQVSAAGLSRGSLISTESQSSATPRFGDWGEWEARVGRLASTCANTAAGRNINAPDIAGATAASGFSSTLTATVIATTLVPTGTVRYRDPAWARAAAGAGAGPRPFVYITFGTEAAKMPAYASVYREAVRAVEHLDADVLITLGWEADPGMLRGCISSRVSACWIALCSSLAW